MQNFGLFFLRVCSSVFTAIIAVIAVVATVTVTMAAATAMAAERPAAPLGFIPGGNDEGVIYRCEFDETVDLNADLWPDGWTRRRDVEFPQHLVMEIQPHPSPVSLYHLRILMNTGGAAVFSPAIPVQSGLTYRARCYVTTQNIVHDDVFCTLSFFDDTGQLVADPIRTSPKIRQTNGYVELEIPPAPLVDTKAVIAKIGLWVLPSTRQDLNGIVDIAKVELLQSPTVRLSTGHPTNMYTDLRQLELVCEAVGISPSQITATVHLEDTFGESVLPPYEVSLFGNEPPVPFVKAQSDGTKLLVRGRAVFKPRIRQYGFYRIRVEIPGPGALRGTAQQTVAVIEPYPTHLGGEFGWTLPDTLRPQEIMNLRPILEQAALSKIKIPVWLSPTSPSSEGDTLSSLCQWLADQKMMTVGLLSNPPPEVQAKIRYAPVNTSTVFYLPDSDWFPTLEPTLLRLAMVVQHWQLGGDEDHSLSETAAPAAMLRHIRSLLNTVAFDVSVGCGWNWVEPFWNGAREQQRVSRANGMEQFTLDLLPQRHGEHREYETLCASVRNKFFSRRHQEHGENETLCELCASVVDNTTDVAVIPNTLVDVARWYSVKLQRETTNNTGISTETAKEFASLSSPLPMTDENFRDYLQETANSPIQRWVVLRPVSKQEYTVETQIADMVFRMIAAKRYGAEAVFVPTPFDPNCGMFGPQMNTMAAGNGLLTPTELFLPWRTTAKLLSGVSYQGEVTLPNRSRNMIFEREGAIAGENRNVMVIWNPFATLENPVTETLFLGDSAEIVDLWGNRQPPVRDGFRQVIPVGPLPTFVTGIDMQVARWRQGFSLEKKNILSVIGPRNPNRFTFWNDSDSGISGTITAIPPPTWELEPLVTTLMATPDERVVKSFTVRLLPRAVSESEMLRFDCRMDGGDVGIFDVYDQMDVGGGDIQMQFTTSWNPQSNRLLVYQAFINNGQTPVSYICKLRIPGRPFLQHGIRDFGNGREEYMYTIDRGDELIGKTFSMDAVGVSPGTQPLRFEFQANR